MPVTDATHQMISMLCGSDEGYSSRHRNAQASVSRFTSLRTTLDTVRVLYAVGSRLESTTHY